MNTQAYYLLRRALKKLGLGNKSLDECTPLFFLLNSISVSKFLTNMLSRRWVSDKKCFGVPEKMCIKIRLVIKVLKECFT